MKGTYVSGVALVLLLCTPLVSAQHFKVSSTGTFRPQNKKVLLLKASRGPKQIILFQTNLHVNTDGSPRSYHPQDPRGRDKALNNICNAIAVRKGTDNKNLCLDRSTFSEAIGVFESFRDSDYQTIPEGYRITWQNVLATAKAENGKNVPCVFKSGPFAGYFGSLTALKNDLEGDKGECGIDDQVDPLTVPALVLVGGQNVVKDFGAGLGDLLFAYNPKTKLFSAAIIGDTGPKDNLGEGTVLLNMRLLGETVFPANKSETLKLSIEDTQVLVAIIPSSHSFQATKPHTAESINRRVNEWLKESGFSRPDKFIKFMKSFQRSLR